MNKELIIKYKAEFDHWLNGGTVLVNYENKGWTQLSALANWEHVKPDTNYIINDEYVEFRKALAEGKTIQMDVGSINNSSWKDCAEPTFAVKPKLYRVKPEPIFQVGDWIETITGDFIKWEEDYVPHKYDTKWQPQPGEMCVFWDDESRYTIAPFDNFGAGGMPYSKGRLICYDNVAPVVFDLNIYKG